MHLPVMPFVAPMLAKPLRTFPTPESIDGGVAYEPKWDGFRCILYRHGDEVVVGTRDGKDLTHCFPEVVDMARQQLPRRIVVDGELIIVADDHLDFEALGSRIRPRSEAGGTNIASLAEQHPAHLVAFDLLALEDRSLIEEPFATRRTLLEGALGTPADRVHLTPLTLNPDLAMRWFNEFEGAGLDGLIIKPLVAPYSPGSRTMFKFKHTRTADVVVAGWREHKTVASDGSPLLGSLLLGAYDDDGRLHHLGVCAAFTATRRAELVSELASLTVAADEQHPWVNAVEGTRAPGGASRWTGGRDLSFHPLRPERVVEVGYDQLQGDRFRHTAAFVRWRPDRDAISCTYEQFDRPRPYDIADVLGAQSR